ncbi:MAG TPA: DUF222 domain-containing protein [Candidatus Acidoferrum sp.]|nr:DUF222 domain-containing protein [Candidatus Acidoferrum sp.]
MSEVIQRAARLDASREELIGGALAIYERLHQMPKADLAPEQHARALMQHGRIRDLSAIEMSEHTAELEKTDACTQDWGSTSTIDWVRHTCHMPSGAAFDLSNVGQQVSNLSKTLDAVREGRIGFAHAAIIARHAQAITHSESAEAFDERPYLKAAETRSVGRLWHHAMHEWHRKDPEGVADQQRQAVEDRYLRFTQDADGTFYVKGQFDSAAGATIRSALDPRSQPLDKDDGRSLDRRRADAFVEQCNHDLDTGSVPQHGSVRPHIQVTTTLETLQGLIGSPAGEMELSLPISSKTVQRFACDSSITRVLLGSDSIVVDAGRAKRVVSHGSRRLLEARDKHCRWPGCERPTAWTAAHHIRHWAQGGKTELTNMILLCQHHHWMVHEGGWRLTLAADERVIAIAPDTEFYSPDLYPSARAPDEFDVA